MHSSLTSWEPSPALVFPVLSHCNLAQRFLAGRVIGNYLETPPGLIGKEFVKDNLAAFLSFLGPHLALGG